MSIVGGSQSSKRLIASHCFSAIFVHMTVKYLKVAFNPVPAMLFQVKIPSLTSVRSSSEETVANMFVKFQC